MFSTPPEPDLHAIVAWVRRGQVAFATSMPQDPATASTALLPATRRARRRRLATLLTVLAAGGLGHAGLLFWMGTKATDRPQAEPARATPAAPATESDEAADELAAGDALLAAATSPDAEELGRAARHFARAVRLRESTLAAAADPDARREAALGLAVALERFGTVDLAQGFFGDAERSLARAEAIAAEIRHDALVRSIAARRGEAALGERRPKDALDHLSRALGDAPSVALLERLAIAALAAGEAERAMTTLERALTMPDAAGGDPRRRAALLERLGQAACAAGRHADGITALEASLATLVALGASPTERADATERIADAEERAGRGPAAIAALQRAIGELGETDHAERRLALTMRIASAAVERGDRATARRAAADAIGLAEASGTLDDDILLRIGDLRRDAGDLDGAATAYQSALASRQAAAVAEPSDAERARALVAAQQRVAALALLRERPAEAKDFAERARTTLASVAASRGAGDPAIAAELALELASLDQMLGDIALADGRFEEAVRAFGRARDARRAAFDRNPASMAAARDLGETLASLGAVALRIGRVEVALRHLEENLALHAAMAERPGAPSAASVPSAALRGHASALDRLANAQLASGNSTAALATFERSLAIRTALGERDPEGPTTLDELADAHEQLASMLVIRGELREALGHAEAALLLRRRCLATMPDDELALASVASSLARHGDIAFALGDLERAEISHRAALEHRLSAALRRPTDERLRRDVAVSHCSVGRVAGARGQAKEAIARLEEAERLLRTIARRGGEDEDLRQDLATVAVALERMRSAESASP